MAYPTVSAPYGFKPINLVGGLPYAGSTRMFAIANNSTTAIFYGQAVALTTAGVIEGITGTDTGSAVGVFLGCQYIDPSLGYVVDKQYYPGAIAQDGIVAYVSDDPNALYKIAVVSGTTTISTVGRAAIGSNMALVQNTGSTTTGDAKTAVLSTSPATTNTLPVRVIDVVPDTATGTDAFTEVVVKFNLHQYNSTTGI
jgi:hypothetical protein